MSKSSNDLKRVKHAMCRYATLIRQNGHEVYEFYEDCVIDPAIRRWIVSSTPSDHRAVLNDKAFLKRMLVDFEGMMSGTFVRPSYSKKASQPSSGIISVLPILQPAKMLPMVSKVELEPVFDWKSIEIRHFSELNLANPKNASHSVIRRMYNEYLRITNLIVDKIEATKTSVRQLEKELETDTKQYVAAVNWLEKALELEKSFNTVPTIGINNSMFQIVSSSIVEEPKSLLSLIPLPSLRKPVQKGKGPSELQSALKEIFLSRPGFAWDAHNLFIKIKEKLPLTTAIKVTGCLINAAKIESKNLPIKRVGRGKYTLSEGATS
jgi:hypothetical protein